MKIFKFLKNKQLKKKLYLSLMPIYNRALKKILPKSFLLKKYELVAIGERMRMYKNPRWVTLDIVGNPDIKLNLQDISKGLPFKSNSLKSIYSSHNLEHISIDSSISFFREVKRTLRNGGELLLDVPCSETIYKLIGKSINEPQNLKLKRFLKTFKINDTSLKISYATCPSNKSAPIDWVKHPINKLSQIISCYMNGIDDNHLPIINNPQEVIKAYRDLSMDDFFEYLFAQIPSGMRYSGGHCEAWYPEKAKRFLEKEGFITTFRFTGESKTLIKNMVPDRGDPFRDAYSFKISAVKSG